MNDPTAARFLEAVRWLAELCAAVGGHATVRIDAYEVSATGVWPTVYDFVGDCNAYVVFAERPARPDGVIVGYQQVVSRALAMDDPDIWRWVGEDVRRGLEGHLVACEAGAGIEGAQIA